MTANATTNGKYELKTTAAPSDTLQAAGSFLPLNLHIRDFYNNFAVQTLNTKQTIE